MDSRVGKNPDNEVEQQIYLGTFHFHHVHLISSSFVHVFKTRYPQILVGTMAAIFGYQPCAYATGVVTR